VVRTLEDSILKMARQFNVTEPNPWCAKDRLTGLDVGTFDLGRSIFMRTLASLSPGHKQPYNGLTVVHLYLERHSLMGAKAHAHDSLITA
jgi:hypothetical protein